MKARELGIEVGNLPTGSKNCITDVKGVKVGHITLNQDINDGCIRTGVTAILPHEGNLFLEKVRAACYVANGFGKTTGLVQVEELGCIESPIMLTNTFSVGPVLQGTLQYMLAENPAIGDSTSSINIIVGECNDSYLNSIRLLAVKPEHAIQAIQCATNQQAEEGAVGAGTGTMCFGYKGGIGSSSRLISEGDSFYTVGILVQSNFGSKDEFRYANSVGDDDKERPDGSIMMVLATDAPVSDRQLKRLAKRCVVGLSRIGSHIHNGSGDVVIAFSNAETIQHSSSKAAEQVTVLHDDHPIMNLLFQAVAEATEEAILNSLSQAETTSGRKGRVGEKAPIHRKS
ncbi:P1 family peptidase [Heyndrickxia oleronia]|uniref:Aminopeptidase n=1 Tax=Heyndrickxia oleronia TaxID=38875 RepID=A0A8E2I5T9_9BACI|nr:P1 family peptidase [Heyndrickxia oleronia]MEC1372851.1 P1 family peptidase [Heyndrickxia oleronia]OJH17827.1 aminopeptidase [Bacillus obstructivus]OOP66570.1 aminopeptidase [Heyndrickxia oleronia]QQZ03446.1 P1 family peptidase [Heyndrickxia oleronia]